MGGFCVSCAESDDFSSSSDLKLSFSKDTITFDMVFTTIGSSVVQFKIYNRNNKSLSIESIEIVNSEKSGFTMNIDGEQGTRITNVDVLKRDSLYGFLRVTVDPFNENNPILIRDSIRFVTNGNVQYVILEAIGRNVHIIKGKEITEDTFLKADKPYLIYDSLNVARGVKLTIEAGAEFFFHDKASLNIWGTLKAEGELTKKIVFRNDRFDKMNGVIPYSNIPGQWNGIVFHSDSYDNSLKNVVVKNAVVGLYFQPSDISKKKAQLYNVEVGNSSDNCVMASNCYIDAVNCLFSNSRKAVLNIQGGNYSFLHCTIANYYQWSTREGAALALSNDSDNAESPLVQCDFINSIVYGTRVDELALEDAENQKFNFRFLNCLIRSKQGEVGEGFVDVVWNKNPEFLNLNSSGLYEYDFRLSETSYAIGIADIEYSEQAAFDLKGNVRLMDGSPDAGCFEWMGE